MNLNYFKLGSHFGLRISHRNLSRWITKIIRKIWEKSFFQDFNEAWANQCMYRNSRLIQESAVTHQKGFLSFRVCYTFKPKAGGKSVILPKALLQSSKYRTKSDQIVVYSQVTNYFTIEFGVELCINAIPCTRMHCNLAFVSVIMLRNDIHNNNMTKCITIIISTLSIKYEI